MPRAAQIDLRRVGSWRRRALLLLQVDALVLAAADSGTNLGRGLASPGLAVGDEDLFGASGALSAVQPLETTPETGVAQSPIAAAIAWKLKDHIPYLGCLLINVDLPGVAEVLTGELGTGKDRRQRAQFERSGLVICRNIVCRV